MSTSILLLSLLAAHLQLFINAIFLNLQKKSVFYCAKQPFLRKAVFTNKKSRLLLETLHYIINGCLQNSPRDQKKLYEQYYGYCLKIVFRYVYHYDKAVDVVNDAFIKVFKNLNSFYCNKPDNLEPMFLGWVRTIMINTAIDRLRKDNFLPEIGIINENVWIEDKGQASDQQLLYKELILEVKKLSPVYRTVFNMYVIDGFTHQEIANQLKIAVGTSKSNLFKAREILQKAIKKNEDQSNICRM